MAQQPTWFSEDQYYASKMIQLKAMGYTKTLDELKADIEAMGGAWVHYERHGTKETYPTSNMQIAYIPLKNAAGDVVFDPQVYCESKLEQLNSYGSEFRGQFSTWQEVAAAINATGQSLYQHYFNHGQYEGLSLNENFNSLNFYRAKLAYLEANPDVFGSDWTLEKVMDTFRENGLDAYQNWVDFGAEEGIIPALVSPNDSGTVFELTTGFDNLTGTSGNDFFMAYAFGDANSLNTGDRINGGSGTDTLFADLVGSDIALTPITDSVEIVKFRVQDRGSSGEYASNNVKGYIDAERMVGVKQFWSTNSRADLLIEDVRINSTDVTVVMQSSDPGDVDYQFYFREPYLVSTQAASEGTLYLQLIDSQGALDGSPLLQNAYDTVRFHYNGEHFIVNFGQVNGDSTYEDLRDAIQAALDDLGLAITATLGSSFTQFDGLTGLPVTGTTIVLEGSGSFDVSTTTGEFRDGWGASAGLDPDNSLSATMRTQTSTECPLIQTNIGLDDVASIQWVDPNEVCLPDNTQYGSTSGHMIVGSMATRGGVERFDVTVDRGSWLVSLASTNNALRMITVDDKDWSGNGVEDGGPLFIGGHDYDDQTGPDGVSDMVSWQAATRFLTHTSTTAYPTDGTNIAGIWDVKYFDSTAFSGNVSIAAQFTAEANAKFLEDVDGLRTVYDNYAPDGEFKYNFGKGDDTLNMVVDGGIAAHEDYKLVMSMGDGADWVNFAFDFKTVNQCVDQTNLKNAIIDTGTGDDYVWTWGTNALPTTITDHYGVAVTDYYNGVYGYVNITTGTGADVVYAAQDDGATAHNAAWVLNASGAHTQTSPLDIDFTAVGGAQPHNNNVTSVNNAWTVRSAQEQVANHAYTLYADIEFAGVTVRVNLDSKTIGATAPTSAWSISSDALNKAILKAINEHAVLSKLLVAKDGAGKSLLVESLIDGHFVIGDEFGINFILQDTVGTTTTYADLTNLEFLGFTNQATTGTGTANAVSVHDIPAVATGLIYTIVYDASTYTYTAQAGDTLVDVLANLAISPGTDFLKDATGVVSIIPNTQGEGFSIVFANDTALANLNLTTGITGTGFAQYATNTYYAGGWVNGTDNHYYGLSEIVGGDGNDVLVSGYADAIINGGAGDDTIIVGNHTFNQITAGVGADNIYLGYREVPGTGNNSERLYAYDALHQAKGDSGSAANSMINTAGNTISAQTFDVIYNFDVAASGTAQSDRLHLSNYTGTDVATAITVTAGTVANLATLIPATATNNTAAFIRGVYNAATGSFSISGTATDNVDALLVYDSDASAAIATEAVVLVGVGTAGALTLATVHDATNGDYLTLSV